MWKELKINKELSDVPSQLILDSLEDLKLCEANPNIDVSMGIWFARRKDNSCIVCLAGATMYNNLNEEYLISGLNSNFFVKELRIKFQALNLFVYGDVLNALWFLNKYSGEIQNRYIARYEEDKCGFYKDMYQLVEDLKKVGL